MDESLACLMLAQKRSGWGFEAQLDTIAEGRVDRSIEQALLAQVELAARLPPAEQRSQTIEKEGLHLACERRASLS